MLKTTLTTFCGEIAVVRPQGRLVLGEMDSLRKTIQTTFRNDYRRILIDLANVDKIDCAGLGELVSYYTEARSAGVFLGLTNLTSRICNLLVITKLATIFPIIDDEVFSKNRPKQPLSSAEEDEMKHEDWHVISASAGDLPLDRFGAAGAKLPGKFTIFRDNIAVIKPTRRIVLGEMGELRCDFNAAIGSEYRRIVVDLADVHKIDSAGLGELVSYYTKAHEAGIFIGLTNSTSRMRDLLVITKLATIFPIIDDEVFSRKRPKQGPPSIGPGWWQQLRHSHRDRPNTSI